jgi:hypothetical protein
MPIESRAQLIGQILNRNDFLPQPSHVCTHQLSRENTRSKIAEAALRAAEWDGNVSAQRHIGN